MNATKTCPPDHKHGATTTCHKNHGCHCTPCLDEFKRKDRPIRRRRYRAKAYGTYEPYVPAIGAQRRIQGLQLLGWTFDTIGRELGGITGEATRLILTRQQVTPATAANVERVTRTLILRGRGPSEITTRRAQKAGWIPLLSWDDIDNPDENPHIRKQGMCSRGHQYTGTTQREWGVSKRCYECENVRRRKKAA